MPGWFLQKGGGFPATYRGNADLYQRAGQYAKLQRVAKGQEFIIDTIAYPEAVRWAAKIINTCGS